MTRPLPAPTPSSATSGFFQTAPVVPNQSHEDAALQRIFQLYIPPPTQATITPDLSRFAHTVLSSTTLSYILDAERNPPYLRTWDTFGRRIDQLVISYGWQSLQALGIREGLVAIPYENHYAQHSRVYQFVKYHIWTGSCAYVTCPSAMTDGAARLLEKHLLRKETGEEERKVFRAAFERLVSRDPERAWTSGQWMTERMGGSDVRGTETLARRVERQEGKEDGGEEQHWTDANGFPLGPWRIDGFKWFSSATDSQMAVLLAKTPEGGVSAFWAPMRKQIVSSPSTSPSPSSSSSTSVSSSPSSPPIATLNGIHPQRLKSKLGTRALPTAELVLSGTRAYALGPPGHGTREISTVLNITRIHNAVTAVGLWGRGLAISRAFARVRRVAGRTLLADVPAHVRTLAAMTVTYRASMHLAFFNVALLGVVEEASSSRASRSGAPSSAAELRGLVPGPRDAALLLRLLTPVAKALTAKAAIQGLAECMESLGGVGYLENEDMSVNVARLFRDVNVLSIWEGTTDVMAADVVRVVKGREGVEVVGALGEWVGAAVERWGGGGEREGVYREFEGRVTSRLEEFGRMVCELGAEELKWKGRYVLETLGWLVCAVLLVEDARSDRDEVALEVATRWVWKGTRKEQSERQWTEGVAWDRRIVFGDTEADKKARL